MPFIKNIKSKAYFSRFQTKYRRRREGKTDYYARKRLITQAKNRYATPKYRLVVRFTNTTVICQIIHSKLQGDIVFASAYSSELPKYGIKHGLKNWAAAYATGLLVARRALSKIGLADKYEGVVEPDGSHTMTEEVDDAGRPFKVFLDVGLRKTSTGSRVFGALKGASDGGLYIPHSENRFPGYDSESKSLDADTLRKYIYGGHVGEYMDALEEDDEEKYKRQFSKYIDDDISSDSLEDLYKEAHEKIRADPSFTPTEKKPNYDVSKKYKDKKLSREERKAAVIEKMKKIQDQRA